MSVAQETSDLNLIGIFVMKLQSQILLAGFQNLIVIGKLVNISCYLDAIVFLKRVHNLSHGKTEIQFCLKQTNQCDGSEVYDVGMESVTAAFSEGGSDAVERTWIAEVDLFIHRTA